MREKYRILALLPFILPLLITNSVLVSAENFMGIGNISFSSNPIIVGSNVNASIQIMSNYTTSCQIRVLVNGTNRWNYTLNVTGPGITTVNITLNPSELSAGEYLINFTLYNSTGYYADWAAEELNIIALGSPFISNLTFDNQNGIMNTTVDIVNCGNTQYYILSAINTSIHGNHTITCNVSGSFNFRVNISNLSSGSYILNTSVFNMSGYFFDSMWGDFQLDQAGDNPYFSNVTKSSYEIIQGNTLNVTLNISNCQGPQYRLVFTINTSIYGNHTINCTGNASFTYAVNVSNLSIGIYLLNISLYNISNALLVSTTEDFSIITGNVSTNIYIRVIDPNGGEFLNGTNYTIRFNASSVSGGPLAAYLFYDNDNDTSYVLGPITSGFVNLGTYCSDPDNNTSTVNNCSYLWNFEQLMSNMTLYVGVELKDLNTNGTSVDYSDGSFIVLYANNYQPSITVLDPNGGENATGNYTIRFSISDPDGDQLYVNIFYDNNTNPNDNSWTIATALNLSNQSICNDPDYTTRTTNNCSYVWGIGTELRGAWIYIGIMVFDGISYPNLDYSDSALFANSTQNRVPVLRVVYPGSGDNITGGSLRVVFNVSDPDGDRDLYGAVHIDYDNNLSNGWNYSGRSWNHSRDCIDLDNDTTTFDNCSLRINLNNTLNNTLAWLIAYVLDRPENYQYDIAYVGNITFTGADNSNPVVVVTSPNGGEIINSTRYIIKFNVSDADGNLMISVVGYDNDASLPMTGEEIGTYDLSDSSVCTDLDDNTSTANNCSITWNINTALNNQTLWIAVGINDGSEPLILDYSDGNFTVNIPIYTSETVLTLGWNLISIPLIL